MLGHHDSGTVLIEAAFVVLTLPPVLQEALARHTSLEGIFQSIENLHNALPDHSGDWYFTGNYPTPGGYRVVNQAFINYYEKQDGRSY